MLKKLIRSLQEKIPPEFRRNSSLITFLIIYLLGRIIEGALSRVGELITEKAVPVLPGVFLGLWKSIYYFFSYPVTVNLLQISLFLIIGVPLYKLIDRALLSRKKREVVFDDSFEFGNKGWHLNYRDSNNSDKTCRIEQSSMVFEANDSDLAGPKKENGAYIDLSNGIYKDSKYEISCWVKSSDKTTMGFKLWVHDTKGRGEMKFPANFYTPGSTPEEIKVGFIGTESQALRIHLHYKAGNGKLFVSKVVVVKV